VANCQLGAEICYRWRAAAGVRRLAAAVGGAASETMVGDARRALRGRTGGRGGGARRPSALSSS